MKSDTYKLLHRLFIIIPICLFFVNIYDLGLQNACLAQVKYLSMWGVQFTFWYFVFESFNLTSLKFRKDLFSIVISLNTVITIFYWGFMHKVKPTDSNLFVLRLYTDHIFPLIFVLIEFARVKYKMENYQMKYLAIMTFSYLFLNLTWGHLEQVPIYDIITWDNAFSFIFAGSFISFAFISFLFWKRVNKFKLKLMSQTDKSE